MSKYLIYTLFVILAVTILNSCSNSAEYELTIDKEPYLGNELRIDGYYYYQYDVNENEKYTIVLFFYRNGVVFTANTFTTENFDIIEKFYLDGEHESFIKDRDVWSTFKVNKDTLIYETWEPPRVSIGPTPIKHYCEIINDTTYRVYKRKHYSESEFEEVSETYHFRKFDHKPDSTNNFIK